MQKWIRDRNRRRKKKPADSSEATEQNPPLQPAYPEMTDSPEPTNDSTQPEAQPAEPAAKAKAPAKPARKKPTRRRKKKVVPEVPAEAQSEEATLEAAAEPTEKSAEPVAEVPASEPEAVSAPEAEASASDVAEPVATSQAEPEPVAVEAPDVPEVEPVAPPVEQLAPSTPEPEPAPAAPAPVVPPAPQLTSKRSKGAVVLAVGLPGSGKSTWFKRRGVTPLSSDMVRHLLFDSPTEQRYQDLVFGTLRSLLRARLIARMPMNYVDATNLSPKERRHWIKMAKDFGFEVHAVYFDVPLEVCGERNRKRGRVVPDEVMQRMAAKLKPPTFDEGFSKIIVVRVKHRPAEPEKTQGATETE